GQATVRRGSPQATTRPATRAQECAARASIYSGDVQQYADHHHGPDGQRGG
ncbi:MAG: SSU ribosomal protein S11p (S14e), partial [uncultured Chloroflexia bacterium]